jgi:gluconolactonase
VGAEFEVVAEDLAFPEGPVLMPDGSVIVMEMLPGRVSRVWGGGRREVVAQLGGGPNGAQLGPDGALYVCNNGGFAMGTPDGGGGRIERIDLATGRVDRLYDRVGEHPLGAPNDIVFDAQGGFWFTDLGVLGERAFGRAGIYYAQADGREIREGFFGGLSYNGIGLSPDEKALYVASTMSGRLYRFDLEAPGRLGAATGLRGTPEQYVGSAPGDGWFDSLAVTQSGAVCVGTIWSGGVTVFTPAGDRRFVEIADQFVTNIAFGGEDMRDAYLTLCGSGRLIRMCWDEPGLRLNFG